jgi:hypothetical protein
MDEFLKGGKNVIPQKIRKENGSFRRGQGLASPPPPSLTPLPPDRHPLFLAFFLSPFPSHGFLPLNPRSATPNP